MYDVIERTPQHTYQILTKRAARIAKYFKKRVAPKNAWLGVSVEDKKYGLPRIDFLRQIDVKVRFLSVEALLEEPGTINLDGIHQVIVSGESGAKTRSMSPD